MRKFGYKLRNFFVEVAAVLLWLLLMILPYCISSKIVARMECDQDGSDLVRRILLWWSDLLGRGCECGRRPSDQSTLFSFVRRISSPAYLGGPSVWSIPNFYAAKFLSVLLCPIRPTLSILFSTQADFFREIFHKEKRTTKIFFCQVFLRSNL